MRALFKSKHCLRVSMVPLSRQAIRSCEGARIRQKQRTKPDGGRLCQGLLRSPLTHQVATNASLSATQGVALSGIGPILCTLFCVHLLLNTDALSSRLAAKWCLDASGRLMLPVVRRCRKALLPAFVEPADNSTKQLPKNRGTELLQLDVPIAQNSYGPHPMRPHCFANAVCILCSNAAGLGF